MVQKKSLKDGIEKIVASINKNSILDPFLFAFTACSTSLHNGPGPCGLRAARDEPPFALTASSCSTYFELFPKDTTVKA